MFQLSTKDGLIKRLYNRLSGGQERVLFRDVGAKLFAQARSLADAHVERKNLPDRLREQLAEYELRAKNVSYEISDYFLTTDEGMAEHFRQLAVEVSKGPELYFRSHYGFVETPQVKAMVVKQLTLAALFGVNAIYRSYDVTRFSDGLDYVQGLIEFLEEDFAEFCGRRRTAFALLGLAYFLKGRLLLSVVRYDEADECFRLSAEYYVKKLPDKAAPVYQDGQAGDSHAADSNDTGSVKVPVTEMLTMRRAALALAFGSGYTALINSRVKEATRLLTLARGILHFNGPPVYAAYTELLYWSAKRAAHSGDARVLLEAKERIEDCRRIFNAEVQRSHYPHRCSIEHALVLHYLAQQLPAERADYYDTAVEELEAAVTFASGEGDVKGTNKQLQAEACYILSHILRYRSIDLWVDRPEDAIAELRKAYRYAKKAEAASRDFRRHRCEALLALCGVYADMAKHGLKLTDVLPRSKSDAGPGQLSRDRACEVLKINDGTNLRISAICFLRLTDYYLKNPYTSARAYEYWEEWLKIKDSIDHAFVNDWSHRLEEQLDEIKSRQVVIDFRSVADVDDVRKSLNLSFARYKIEAWVKDKYDEYEYRGAEIKKKKMGRPGPQASLMAGLESLVADKLKKTPSEAREFITTHDLLAMATSLMESYLRRAPTHRQPPPAAL
jgi:hypothetical protein